MKFTFILVSEQGEISDESLDVFIQKMKAAGHRHTGAHTNPRTREQLQGQPVFSDVLGPMYDGQRGDTIRIRYESEEIYQLLSR